MKKKKKSSKLWRLWSSFFEAWTYKKNRKGENTIFTNHVWSEKNRTWKGQEYEPTRGEMRKVPQEARYLTNQAQMQIGVKHKENQNARKPKWKVNQNTKGGKHEEKPNKR